MKITIGEIGVDVEKANQLLGPEAAARFIAKVNQIEIEIDLSVATPVARSRKKLTYISMVTIILKREGRENQLFKPDQEMCDKIYKEFGASIKPGPLSTIFLQHVKITKIKLFFKDKSADNTYGLIGLARPSRT